MKKTKEGKKVRRILLEICPLGETSKEIERKNLEMLHSNISKLNSKVVVDLEAKEFFKNSETRLYCVRISKLNAERRVIEKIEKLKFKVVSRRLA